MEKIRKLQSRGKEDMTDLYKIEQYLWNPFYGKGRREWIEEGRKGEGDKREQEEE